MWWTLAGCTGAPIQVWGDEPPEPPEGLVTIRAELSELDSMLTVEVPEGTNRVAFGYAGRKMRGHARATHEARPDEIPSVVWPGPPEAPEQIGPAGTWNIEWATAHPERAEPTKVVFQHVEDTTPESGVLTVQVVFTEPFADDLAFQDEVREAIGVWQENWAPYGIEVEAYYQSSNARGNCPLVFGRDPVHDALTDAGADHDLTVLVCEKFKDVGGGAVGFKYPYAYSPGMGVIGFVPIHAGPEVWAQTLAHEVGHAAGLGHAEEDDYSDTPPCPADGDCADVLGHNFMYSSAICSSFGAEPDELVGPGCWRQNDVTPLQRERLLTWIGIL